MVSGIVNNLQLSPRYKQHGGTDDLAREALLNTVRHEAHVQCLNNLAGQLFTQCNRIWG